jgi:hypothetical protein
MEINSVETQQLPKHLQITTGRLFSAFRLNGAGALFLLSEFPDFDLLESTMVLELQQLLGGNQPYCKLFVSSLSTKIQQKLRIT